MFIPHATATQITFTAQRFVLQIQTSGFLRLSSDTLISITTKNQTKSDARKATS
jgi:hypothetical protein